MKIQSVQKIIKIGSNSRGVTLPARDLDAMGIEVGENVMVSVTPIKDEGNQKNEKVLAEYQAFKDRYSQTLKNLADR